MSVTLTGTGGIFTRFGKEIFGGIQAANYFLGDGDISGGTLSLRSVGVGVTNALAQYQSTLQNVIDGITGNRDTVRKALDSWKQGWLTVILNTFIEQVHADNPLNDKTITNALIELIRQMANGNIYSPSNSVDANTVSVSIASDSLITNTGNGVITATVKRTDGRNNEHVLAEVVDVTCTADQATGATARAEQFSIKGEAVVVSSDLDWNWPKGSGASTSLTMVDAAQNNGGGTILYNGSFSAYTNGGGSGNQPDYWGAAVVGVYGTDININSSGNYRTGVNNLKFTGTGGAVLSSIMQKIGVASPAVGSSGTAATMKPNTFYAVNFFAKDSGAGLLAGVVAVSLVDQAGTPAVVNDDAGTANTVSVAFGTTTTSYAAVSGWFLTPKVLPSTGLQIAVRVTTALTNGESMYIADLAITEVTTPIYIGGPYMAGFAGSTPWVKGDKKLATVANDGAGEIQQWAQRCFNMRALGLQLPSDNTGSETIADSLLT